MARSKGFEVVLAGFAVFIILLATPQARAADVDRLLDLLVKKHVVTEEEAAELRGEIEKDQVSEHAQAIVEKQKEDAERKEQPISGSSKIKLSGWAQTRYTSGASFPYNTETFELRRARLAVEGNLATSLAYKVEIDAVRSPALLDARLDYRWKPYARITAGQFKIPFSGENLISDRDTPFIERSLVGLALVPGRDTNNNGRDIGVQLGGTVALDSGRPVLDYAVGVFNGGGVNQRDVNRRKDAATRLVLHPLKGVSVAGDYYNGATGLNNLSKERAGVEFEYAYKLFTLRGEYIWGHDGAVRRDGWYSQFGYRFRPKWEVLARYDTFDLNRHKGNDVTSTYLVGINWYLRNYVKFQANYGLTDEQSRTDLTNLFLSQVQFQF
jgi:phosphate-selective porin OprO and OprP